jgi:hypothetical protein
MPPGLNLPFGQVLGPYLTAMETTLPSRTPAGLTRRGLARACAPLLALPLAGISSLEALFAPRAKPWPRWQAHDPDSTASVDHGAWDAFLRGHVIRGQDGVNRIDYGRVDASALAALDGHLDALAALKIDGYNRAEQEAYWINLYNALTVRLVARHYPVASIRDIDISPGLFADGPWDKALAAADGVDLTLNDIEHRILRPIWRDPRIHYALNCASIGCPNLQDMAYTGTNLDGLFDKAARDYVNSPRAIRFANGGLSVSSIYVWFQEDFGGTDAAIIEHLRRYAGQALAERLMATTIISDHHYDWSLNDVRPLPAN